MNPVRCACCESPLPRRTSDWLDLQTWWGERAWCCGLDCWRALERVTDEPEKWVRIAGLHTPSMRAWHSSASHAARGDQHFLTLAMGSTVVRRPSTR